MGVRSLTQGEAAERSSLLTVSRYDVAIDLTDLLTGSRVRCESTMTFGCDQVGAESFVDCVASIESATLNGVALPAAVEGRITLTDLAESNVLTVVSVSECSADAQGFHRAVDPADGTVYVYTDFTPDYARYVWACFDQPDLKAPHAFTVTAPASGRSRATVATRTSTYSGPPAAGPSPTPRRCRRTTRSSTPAASTRSAARPAGTIWASSPASPWRRSSSATPTSSSR